MDQETLLFEPASTDANALNIVLAFPNTYSIGITSLGYQVVWATLAQRRDVNVKRLFTDQWERVYEHIDLFGLSLSWELDGPVLLDLLEQQRIPFWSDQRGENDPIVFGGGPVLTANPEPLAPFFDVILLGDGELLIPSFIDHVQTYRNSSRAERIRALAQVPGIYVPALYQVSYCREGSVHSVEPIDINIPRSITKQTWKGNTLSHSMVITPQAAWPSIHMVEVVRSCPELCRFCLASYLALPFRTASLEDGLIPAVEKGLKFTRRLGLLGASITQHPQFIDLLDWLDQDQFNNIRLSISSVRTSTVTPKLSRILSKRGSKSITIAIESGSEKIRNVINKKLTQEEIFAAASCAKQSGLNSLKFYAMVGLPTETEEDVNVTAELLLKIKETIPGLRLTLGVSSFVPKAHTPFQWQGVRPEAEKHMKLLGKKVMSKGIDFRPESYGWSLVQAILSRGDRRIAPVIVAVRSSSNSLGGWKRAYKSVQNRQLDTGPVNLSYPPLPPWEEILHQNWDIRRVLPWSHIKGPLPEGTLASHLREAMQSSLTCCGINSKMNN
ncbi:MAG TPA: radical SAM protein [Prochlorococcaceae cyanobacterium AMR_MDS_5431]|nr:radical SAM protein [Prochlorococcaceae cyanobacterium AMR_MDS_5431]